MATLVLAAAGGAIGGAVGGTVAGIGAAAIGQAAGAVVGGLIDQTLLGSGSRAVVRGKANALRIQGANEGAPIPRVQGRMRVAGQMIWSTRFREHVRKQGVGKGGGPTVREYSYTLSFAVALCEGPVTRIGRIWADGKPLNLDRVQWRLHRGTEEQGPDPLIEAVEGDAPAFRGVAYLVFEDLEVDSFGRRAPQIAVEVFRRPQADGAGEDEGLHRIVRGVAMSPGTGEFAYDTDPVKVIEGEGRERFANVNTPAERTDAVVALDQLQEELPACGSVSLVVSWFGDDLRCDRCRLRPGVEVEDKTTAPHEWRVSGQGRGSAYLVGRDEEGRPVFGGTPSDGSIIRYIRELKARGFRVTFYPFLLMDVAPGNGLEDPWGWGAEQPAYPWRGRITTSLAPGLASSPDLTQAAADEVAAFFGQAQPEDFAPSGDTVLCAKPDDWGMRRFILHYAHLCAMAGGVDAFCIGSEMRALTQIRSARREYPAVEALRQLAGDVRAVLGTSAKIGYAADWSEYFGHQPADGTGDRLFHLDPLWGDEEIDFVGIDWYAPLTDWRDGREHLDAQEARSIYDLDYLAGRFAGGEGYDWYYASAEDRRDQIRTPILDGAHGEHWIWRNKDLANWWSRPHHERIDGVRQSARTAWRPRSKPIWLTEVGCAAVDKGTNQPNVFGDPKSSESGLPHFSSGRPDGLIQRRMLEAAERHWSQDANNPPSDRYDGRMLDLERVHVWTWDARPWPEFPRKLEVWSDGGNHMRGHWLTGRVGPASLDRVVAEICAEAGLSGIDVSDLTGLVDGFVQARTQTPREALQALMIAYGFDAHESAGVIRFRMRGRDRAVELDPARVVFEGAGEGRDVERLRAPEGAAPGQVRVSYLRSLGDYQDGAVEAANPAQTGVGVQGAELPLALSRPQALEIAERWARESETARETVRLGLSPERLDLEPGDVVRLGPEGEPEYRIDRIAEGAGRRVEATRIEAAHYQPGERPLPDDPRPPLDDGPVAGAPGYRLMDVPWVIFGGDEDRAQAAVWSEPWPGTVALLSSDRDEDYAPVAAASRPSAVGRLLDDLPAGAPWRWMRGPSVRVEMLSGELSSADALAVFNGANLAALSTPDGRWELLQIREAELVGEGVYALSGFLRGLCGTEVLIGDPAPAGATLVMLGQRLIGFEPGDSRLGLERHYRIGPAADDIGAESYAHAVWTWEGAGLRPHAPVALRPRREAGGDIRVTWIRRGRRDADVWPSGETPLFEEAERYRVRVRAPGGALVREAETGTPEFLYTAAQQAADGIGSAATFEIAQISAAVGPGHEGKATIDG
ncbi:MAG: baseplate multidomain protein megatron [Pseudomonadota bacterium]